MQYRDTGLKFGIVTIVNHWVGATVMLGFVITSIIAAVFNGGEKTARWELVGNLGFLCVLLSAFRLYWRFKHYYPMSVAVASPAQVLVGRAVAYGLLLAGVVLPIILWAQLSAGAATAFVFGLQLPSIWQPDEHAAQLLGILFWLGITAYSAGFLLHFYGAISHHFVQKNDTLRRLLGKNVEL